MAWGLIIILLLGSGLAFPVPDTEFVFIKKYQTLPNSHYLWDTKFLTQALLGSPELHWNAGTFLPNDSGIVLRSNPNDQVYQDFIALPPHNLLAQWPSVPLAPPSDGYWALSFWFRRSKLTADTVILTKHTNIGSELLAISYFSGSGNINVGMSALDSTGVYITGSADCDATTAYVTDWNHIVVRIDTHTAGQTNVMCAVNGVLTSDTVTLFTLQWKDAATEPLYVMASGLSGNIQPLWLYNLAFFFQGMSDLNVFTPTSLQNCGMSTGPGLSCKYCPYGLHTCLITCDLGNYLDQNNVCQSCADVNCAVCSGTSQCTKCNIGYYLAADSQTCVACDGRCAHCWGPNNSQCYACKTPQHDFDTSLLSSSTWMVANNTCEGQPSLLQANPTAASGTFWTAPVTLPVPEKVGNYSEFSVDFWVKLSNAAGPDLATVGVVIDFGRYFFAIKTSDSSLYFEDFKTLKSNTVGVYTQNSWVLATYAMDRYRMRLAYAAAKQGPTTYLFAPVDNTDSSTTSVFQYEPPNVIVLNGHHSYASTRTACGFNNIRIWGKFRTMMDLLADVGVFYTPLNAPPHLLVNYPVLSADKSFLVNSVLLDPTATVVNWNLSPFEYVDQLNATSVLPGNPANFYTNADANRRGDYSPFEVFNGISICPFSQKSVQPAMFGSSALCRDQLRFRFDQKNVAQRIYDSFSYKHLRMGTTYGPDQYDPSISVNTAGSLNEAGLLFKNSMLVLPPTPPEDTVPALQVRTSMTFEAWIKPSALAILATQYTNAIPQGASTIFSMATQRSWPTRVLYLQQVSSGSYTLSYFAKGLYQSMGIISGRLDLKTGLNVGNWMHIAVVTHLYTTTVGYVAGYVNGKPVNKWITDTTENPVASPQYTKDLIWEPYATPIIGATNQFGQWTAFYQGSMFEFDLFNYARSDSEIAADILTGCSGSCTICPSYSGTCLTSAVMTGSFPTCASTCLTCTDGAPSNCLSCYPGTFLDGTSCVQYCSGSNVGNTATGTCVSVSSIKTSATAVLDGLNLVLTFQSAFRIVTNSTAAFDGNTQNALGELFNCKWDSTHTVLTIRLGSRASVAAGDSLTFANNGLTPNPTSPSYVMSSFSVGPVTLSTSLVDLRASIGVTQDRLSKCQDLVFTAVGSTGPRLQFAWQFYVFPLDSAQGKVPGSFSVYAEQNFAATVPQLFFAQAKSLQAVLFVRDMFNRITSVNYTYSLSYSEIPVVYFPYGNYNLTIFRGNAYVFPLDIKNTVCPGHSQKQKNSISVKWTLLNTNATGTSGATAIASTATDHNLKLAAYSMDTLQWYQFQALISDDTYGVSTVLNTTMTVIQRPVVPIILGGNRKVSVTETLVLDGKLSYDPDYTTTALSYCWSVSCSYGGSSYTTLSGCLNGTAYSCTAAGNGTSSIQLNPYNLYPNGVYIFTLTIASGFRTNSATTEIDTVSPVIPIVELYPNVTYYPYKFPSNQSIALYGTITNAARSSLYLSLPAFVNNNEETIPFWGISPYISKAFSTPDFGHVTQLSGFNPNVGDVYTVSLTVDDLLQRGQAWIIAQSNTPPRGGVVYIYPSWAVPAFSEVQISAERFWDSDIPLSYEFYRVQNTSRTLIGRRYNYGLLGRLTVPISPNPIYHELWVYDNNNDPNVYWITAVGAIRPASPDPLSWFSQANQAVADYFTNDVDVAYTNALTFAESLVTAVGLGLIDDRSIEFSGVVGAFLGVLGTGSLTATCQDADLRLLIISTLGQYADSLSADVNLTLQNYFTALVTSSGSCFTAQVFPAVFQLYADFQMDAGTLPDLFAPTVQLDEELVIADANNELVIKRDQFENFYSDPVSGAYLEVGDAVVTISPGAFKLNPTDCIDTRAIIYSYNPKDATESISDAIDLSFSQSCSYAYRQETTMLPKATPLTLATNTTVTVTLSAQIDSRYFTGAVCNVWNDVVGWRYGQCAFNSADLVAGTITCTCKTLGIIAAFIEQTPPAADARTFQKPTVNLFDFSLTDLEYGPETTVDGQYYMNRMNPNYLQLIFFGLYLIGAVVLVALDNKDMKGECRRQEVSCLWYLLREHIFFSLFLSPYRTSKVTRVSRAYVFVTVTHGILAVGGLFYFNNMEQIRDNSDRYRNKDFLVAVYIGLVGMLLALILKTAFNPRLTSERLIGYSLATCFNVLFFIMCVWYTANTPEDAANHWMLTWFLGWACYLAVFDFLVTGVVILFFDCLTIPINQEEQGDGNRPSESEIEIPLQQHEPSVEEPAARRVPYIVAPQDPKAERKRRRNLRRAQRDQLLTPEEREMKRVEREEKKKRRLDGGYTSSEDSQPDLPGGVPEDNPEFSPSTRR